MIAMALGVAVVIGLGFFGFSHFRPPTYETLFSNLSPDDANAVIIKLDAQKIPHKLSADGTTIYVPADVVADERVQLAGDGTVKGGGTGFELFDRTNLGMTDTQEKIAKVRATEGELQRTIAGLTPVESARVHIAEPDATLYSTTQEPTTASVAIRTKPGETLSPDQVRGITQLVSGAVEGLKPDNVTIVNQDGTVLVPTASNTNPDGSAANADALKMTNDQLVAKQRYETNLQENIQGLLDASIGVKRSAVRVATDMNFDAGQTDTESYAPNGTVRSSQTERESFVGTGGARQPPTGVPGTTTNTVPTYQGEQQNTGNSRYTKSKNTTNYEITKTTSKHIDAPGKVTRLSVAVLVNVPAQSAAVVPNGATAANAAAAPVYTIAAADVAKIRNVVSAAAGIDPTRGDVISVEAIPFAPPPETGNRVTTTTILGIPVAALIAIAVVILLVGAGAVALSLRRRAVLATTVDLPSFDSALADELPSFEEHPMLEGSPVVAAPIRSAADLTREQMIEYVTTVAQENPDSLAKLVKLWLAE
jgi:flagellar M-ring protein FliF